MFFPTNPSLSLSNMLNATEGRSYIASSNLSTIAGTSETAFMYINNPSASLLSWCSYTRKFLAATATHTATFKFYWSPNISANGTAVAVNNLINVSGSPASAVQVFKSPTATSFGTLISVLSATNVENVTNVPLIVAPGNSMLITVTAQSASDVVMSELVWLELGL